MKFAISLLTLTVFLTCFGKYNNIISNYLHIKEAVYCSFESILQTFFPYKKKIDTSSLKNVNDQ